MQKFVELNDNELENIIGGSSDGFWTWVGYTARVTYNTARKYPAHGTTLVPHW
ncbi:MULTISPECIES: bacteriocin [Fructobacillus]|uniref:bacteriocin n=1 Tax=Fructobacillus TaxID=559173 RepID=UPI00065DB06A|nr:MULTISPECIES: bacteriocin [Fructobacillus]KMK52605.1 COMC family protein [Fructobacillus sp. EFB-N1]MCK8628120.1 bacteriocin [Fructobacillus cardui]